MSQRRKVVHLTSVHSRGDTRIFLKECRSLAASGYDVSMVVADGKGYEERDGVSIIDAGKGSGRRFDRMLRTVNRVFLKAASLRADVYHLHDPELLRIAMRLKQCGNNGNAAVVFDAHEDLPRQIRDKPWIPSPLRSSVAWCAERLENYVAHRLTGVVTATPYIAKRFCTVNANTIDVNNYPMPEEFASPALRKTSDNRICYIGGITRIRGLKKIISALPLMQDVSLVLCGQFSEPDFEGELRKMPGWCQVDYRGHVSRVGLRSILSESLAGIVTFLPAANHVDAQPNKMFEYMSAGLPVIASDFPLWRLIIDGAQAGICVDPSSPEAIAGAVRRLVDNPEDVARMGKAGRRAILERFNWPYEAEKLIHFYEGLQ